MFNSMVYDGGAEYYVTPYHYIPYNKANVSIMLYNTFYNTSRAHALLYNTGIMSMIHHIMMLHNISSHFVI
jgi:hypothetical protein